MAFYTVEVHRITREKITVEVAAPSEGLAKVRAEQHAMDKARVLQTFIDGGEFGFKFAVVDRSYWADKIKEQGV